MARTTIPSYSPRWLSGVFRFLDSLPVPFWLIGAIYVVALAAVRHWIAWDRGLLAQGEINSFLVVNPLYPVSVIALWLYLDKRAMRAIQGFYEYGGKRLQRIRETQLEFLSLPAWPAAILFIIGSIGGIFNFMNTPLEPAAAQVLPLVSIFGYMLTIGVSALFVLRVILQIRQMRNLLASVDADIFNPQPVYELSNYGAAVAFSVILAYGILRLGTILYFTTFTLIFSLVIILLPVMLIFFAPLIEINARMGAQKARLRAELGNDLRSLQTMLHGYVKARKFAKLDKLRGALAAVREQRDLVQKISTWPWQPDTLRNLLTPLLIPVLVYVVQRFLGSFLGLP